MANASATAHSGEYDRWLFYTTFTLVGLGLLMIFSATVQSSNGLLYLKRQILFVILGTILMVAASRFPYRFWKKLALPIMGITLFFVILTIIPGVGHKIKGATRWIRIGGFSLQPTEFLKIALVILMAASLSKKGERVREFSIGVLPHLILIGFIATLVILQPDFGTVVILCAVTGIMMFSAGTKLTHLAGLLLVAILILSAAVGTRGYRMERLKSFMDPWAVEKNGGYQVTRSLMAYGSGGITGKGISNSELKLKHLPECHTDFIFPILGEELGLIGVLSALGLYVLLLARGFIAAMRCDNMFGSLLAVGLCSVIGIQIIVNLSVTMGILPPTGLTLPLMSYGGSSLLCTMLSIGIVLNVARETDHVR
ncbi:putative lipid II flippase FtsW [Desulfoluna limicola]|uniref:Probable peptidoglycan glycosyltransferase FtsW n=1 Tax=Desulfoluna limicola TaxID=2810562 RepID=A0ABN6EVU4_9BACT|nr:putative lipid II flippase FtsW [Desulfoluna limicola]BCS94463.1 putative lipid II flippase FtsW [Desulfoluna limicola]